MNKIVLLLTLLCGAFMFGQTTVTGLVTDSGDGEPIPGVNIRVVGKSIGTSTDFDGKFALSVNENVPFSIEVTFVGYQTQTVEVTENEQYLEIAIIENATSLDEVVVSASRTPESIRESPVTIERIGIREIKSSATASFYEGLEDLKGVDINKGSLTFNSVNTRGFATFANERFVQLVDGMDNASPALNFVIGNLIGVTELDLQSVEIIPGASSALYGANAFNGILFMQTRSPFEDQGISAYYKTGITAQEAAGDNNFYDFGIRIAHAFSEKFAAKATFSYMRGTDWFATDRNEYNNSRTAVGEPDEVLGFRSSPAHDGINIYGDEVTLAANNTDLKGVAENLEALGILPAGASNLVPAVNVGRTGYMEQNLTDYKAESMKFDASLNFRPWENDFEIIFNTRAGFGSTIYQGANRYQLRDFSINQNRLEIRNNNFFLRGYITTEDAGDSYDMRFTGINMAKYRATEWFGAYAGGYVQAVLNGANDDEAHKEARRFADSDPNTTPQPGSALFEELFNEITSDPDLNTGSKFIDKTSSYVAEGNYNFGSLLNETWDLQLGGSARRYSLNSEGTIFTDYDGPIDYNEYGAYVQAIKKLLDERLKLQASIRYDKNEFFDGFVSPRASVTYAAGDKRNHNFRGSFQTGFRNPTTQDLFIGLDAGRAILVGSSPDNLDRILPNTTLTGRKVYTDSYTLQSVNAFSATGDPTVLESVETDLVSPERIQSYDFGYRGIFGKIYVDLSAYYSKYKDFISNTTVITPIDGTTSDISGVIDIVNGNFDAFQTYTNSRADIDSYGGTIGVNARFLKKLNFGVNYTLAKFDFDQESDPDFAAGFNTPEHKFKVSLGGQNIFDRFGFAINVRWSDEYLWQSSIANAVIPSRTVVDTQVNFVIPEIKSMFKFGASNIGGLEYQSAVGSPLIGSQYFFSWVINQ